MAKARVKQLAAIFVALLIFLLPVSVSAQYADYAGASTGAGSAEPSPMPSSPSPISNPISNSDESETISTGYVGIQGCPSDYPYECGGKCWSCGSGNVVSCYNNKPYCCPTAYPSYCGKTSSCWADSSQCSNAIQCNGQWWACSNPTSAIPNCVNNQVYCCLSDTPYYWGGSCHKCQQDYPNECGGSCWKCNNPSDVSTCYNGQFKCCPSSYPNYCGTNNMCWTQSWMCGKSISCGGSWQVCGSSSDTAYCNNGQLKCCPSDKPYYWNGQCSACTADYPNKCGGQCWKCNNPSDSATCYNDQFKCCPSDFPVYCARTDNNGKDACWKSSTECDKAQKCSSESWTLCRDTSYPNWNCRSDGVSRCCPTGYPYLWSSDWLCHTNQEQQKCAVPDGSSASCTCFSNSDCPADKHYCEQNYPSPISDGYDACVASPPEYCGNGNCNAGSGEDYKNCAADCAQNAPKGTISVDVYYSSGANANKPISGAYVSLDSVQKGTTGSDGKISFVASYGSRNVKVECPDGAFCAEKTVGVDGTESVSFGCSCNPSKDSDGDGYSNEDEGLLGTDPNDAKENYASVFSGFEHPKSCLDIPALIGLVWNKKDNLIQANDIAIAALNTTAVMAADFSASSSAAIVALSVQEVLANADVVPIEATLMESLEASEAVGGFFTDNGAILVMTDYNTSTTAIIAISATCVGWGVGGIYGAGTGVKDDVVGIWELLQGLWYAATHITEIPKIVGDVVGLIKSIPDIFGKAGEIFHDAMMGVLQKGSGVTQKTGLFKSDRQAYLQFQLGFLNGFVTGYVLEQIAATFVGAGAILKGVKSAGFAGKAGKTLKLSKLLTEITQKYGGEVASAVKNLKYADRIVDWAEAEREALVRLVKLKHEKWLWELSEAEARAAAKNIGKLADADISNLLKTKLGQRTLKAADATDDLLAKQAKLVGKWGVSKADEVVSKCFFFVCYGNRIDDLNKILKAMPEGVVDGFDSQKAVKFLGNKDVVKGAEALAKNFDSQILSNLVKSADEFEDLAKGASIVNEKFGLLDNFYPALKKCFGSLGISVAAVCSPEEYATLVENLKSLGVHTGKIFTKYGKDGLDLVLIGTKRLQNSGLVFSKLPFSDADKIKFLKDLGEAETAFGVSEKGLKKIEFVDDIRKINPSAPEDAVGLFDFDALGNPTIYISETASKEVGPNIMKYPLFHEYGHAKMFDLGVDIDKLVKSVPVNKIRKSIRHYDEFLTDILAAEKFGKSASAHIFLLQDAKLLQDLWDFDFAEIARRRAIAIKLGRSDITKEIDDVIKPKSNFNKIKSLSEKFVKNSDFLAKSADEQAKMADEIAKETLELLEGS